MPKVKKIIDPKTGCRTKRNRIKEVLDTTTNSRVYKIALKHYRASHCDISCDICPYHKHENARGYAWKRRSWKHYRKTQYKVKKYVIEFGE